MRDIQDPVCWLLVVFIAKGGIDILLFKTNAVDDFIK